MKRKSKLKKTIRSIRKLNKFKGTSIILCLAFTGLSLYNQFGYYYALIGLTFAVGASGIIESFRLYVLYVIFGRDIKGFRLWLTCIGYLFLALTCFTVNFLAIEKSIRENENHIDITLLSQYQEIKSEVIKVINGDIENYESNIVKLESDIPNHNYHIALNGELLKINPGNLVAIAKTVERKESIKKINDKVRVINTEISALNAEINKISKTNPANNGEIMQHGLTLSTKYDVPAKFDKIYTNDTSGAPNGFLGLSENATKLLINLAILLLIEMGIITTAMSAKSNGKKGDTENQKPITKSEPVIKSDKKDDPIEKEYQKIITDKYYSGWLGGRRSRSDVSGKERREFTTRVNNFFKTNKGYLKEVKK
jgi:hypothetical protein